MVQAGRVAQWMQKSENNQLLEDPVLAKFFEQAEMARRSIDSMVKHPKKTLETVVNAPQLEIVSFGEVQVRRNQRVVGSSDWQTREARDLFFFLLQSPPLSKEQIALEFWPDISPARLKMRFKINIYRIRQAVGQDVILYENERYGFNRTVNHTWDRKKLDGILNIVQNMEGAEKFKLLKEAMGILRHPYLADLDAEWAMADRLMYQEKYQEILVELATAYLEMDQPRDCLKTAGLALEADPLLESAHRLMIQAYATLHDPAGMTLQYRRYQQVLLVELGIQPSSEMSALYEHLLDTI
jgi:two-component SAPR family response regulator